MTKHSAVLRCGASVISVACTPTADVVVAGSVDRKIYRYSGHAYLNQTHLTLDHEVWSVAIDASGQTIVAGTASKLPATGTVHMMNADLTVIQAEPLGAPIWGVATSPSGEFVAATTWAGTIRIYRRITSGIYEAIISRDLPDAASGLYGIAIDDNGLAAMSVYDTGISTIDSIRDTRRDYPIPDGLYNLKMHDRFVVVGTRSGAILRLDLDTGESSRSQVSERPVSGVGLPYGRDLVFSGGFDGSVKAHSRAGVYCGSTTAPARCGRSTAAWTGQLWSPGPGTVPCTSSTTSAEQPALAGWTTSWAKSPR